MDFRLMHHSMSNESITGISINPFESIILNFGKLKGKNSVSELISSIYEIPILSNDDIIKILDMYKGGSPVKKCLQSLKTKFVFDPAFVSGCIHKQFEGTDVKIGLEANAIGWMQSDEFINSDFFTVLSSALIDFALHNDDKEIVFLLNEVISVYAEDESEGFSLDFVNKISDFAKSRIIFAHELLPALLTILDSVSPDKRDSYKDVLLVAIRVLITKDTEPPFEDILNSLAPYFDEMNITAAFIFLHLTEMVDNTKCFNSLISVTKKAIDIIRESEASKFLKTLTEDTHVFEDLPNTKETISICPSTFSVLSDGVQPPTPDMFESGLKIEDILSIDGFVERYSKFFLQLPSIFVTGILSMFCEAIDECKEEIDKLKIIAFTIQVLKLRKETQIPNQVVDMAVESKIFTSRQCVFDKGGSPEVMNIISTLRNGVVEFSLANSPDEISRILEHIKDRPLLFADVIGRIQAYVSFTEIPTFMTKHILRIFANISSTLIYYILNSEEHKPEAYKAWSTMFCYLCSIMEDANVCSIFLSSPTFSSFLLSHMFQPSLIPILRNILTKYFSQNTLLESCVSNLISFLTSVISFSSMDNKPYEKVIIAVLELVSTTITHNPSVARYVASVTSVTFNHIVNYPSTSLLQAVLNMMLNISLCIDNFEFSKQQIFQLGQAIKQTEPDGTSEQTRLMLVSILAQSKAANTSSMFLIHAPAFIILLLNTSSSDLANVIQFFDSLIKFSIYNCIQCHNGGLDLFLIEVLRNYPNPFKYKEWYFPNNVTDTQIEEIIFPLLNYMFLTKTSLLVVERFVSLAVPYADGTFPKNAEMVITKLNQTMTNSPRLTKLTIAYSNTSPVFDYPSIPMAEFENGVTFIFQCMFDKALTNLTSSQPIFLNLYDDETDSEIIVFANGTTLFCEIRFEGHASAANLYSNFEPCKWTFVSLVFCPKSDGLRLMFSVNGEQPSLFHMRIPRFEGEFINISIGGFRNDAEKSPYTFCYLGPYMVLNNQLTQTEILRLYSGELEIPSECTNLAPLQEDWTQESYFHTIKIIAERSDFFSCLVPFFNFYQLAPPHFLERITDILQHIPADNCFKYYPIIANYLYNLPSESLTYQFYLRFVQLLSTNQSRDLFTHIIFNIDLWIVAPAQQLSRIAAHWSQILLPGFQALFEDCFNVTNLSSIERAYLYIDKTETEIISKRERAPDIDIHLVRQHVDRIVVALAKLSLSQKDVATLISHSFTCKDIKQIPYFLDVIYEIAPLIKNNERVANEIHFLFLRDDPQIFISTLRAIISLSKETIAQHIEMICCHINQFHAKTSIFEAVLSLCNDNPAVINVAAAIATKFDDNTREIFAQRFLEIAQNEENCLSISKVRTWFIFPIINALLTRSTVASIGAAMSAIILSDFHFSFVDHMFCFIDQLHLAGYDINELRSIFLSNLADYALKKNTNTIANNALWRTARYLLFTFLPSIHSRELISEVENSPFCQSRRVKADPPKITTFEQVSKLMEGKSGNLTFRIKPSLDESLITKVAKLTSYITNQNDSSSLYIEVFDYLAKRKTMTEEERFERLQSITPQVHQIATIMDLSYHDFMEHRCKSMQKIVTSIISKANKLLSTINEDIVSVSSSALHIVIGLQESSHWTREYMTYKFTEQNMHDSSIWYEFAPTKEESKSFIICKAFSSPLSHPKSQKPKERKILSIVGKPLFTCSAELVTLKHCSKCAFAIFQDFLIFKTSHKEKRLEVSNIKCMLQRTRKGRLSCLEFVSFDRHTIFVDFAPRTLVNILPNFASIKFSSKCMAQYTLYPIFLAKQDISHQWITGRMNNYEYLLHLNFMGGRSYKCAQIYPIMPNILADIRGDIKDKMCYRDFKLQKNYSIRPLRWLQTFHNYESVMSSTQSPTSSTDSTLLHFLNDSINDESEISIDSRIDEDDSTSEGPSISIYDTVELTPEFYNSPECFPVVGNDLVRKLRKALESPFITSQLHIWIDQIFGINQQPNSRVAQLFTNPHLARHSTRVPSDYKNTEESIPIKGITCAAFDYDSSIVVRGIAKGVGLFQWKDNELNIITKNTDLMTFVPYKGGCALVNNQDAGLTLYDDDQFLISPVHEAHYFGSGSRYGVCCGREGVAYCIDGRRRKVFGVCHVSPESPRCVCSSSEFRIVVVGTKENALMVFDLGCGNYIRTIKLSTQPKDVIVTKGIGYIVVFSTTEITVLSLLGSSIVTKTYEDLFGQNTFPVCCCAVPSNIYTTEDSIVVCDSKKRSYIIDTTNLSIIGGTHFAECSSTPICVRCYEKVYSNCAIYTLGDDGQIITTFVSSLNI